METVQQHDIIRQPHTVNSHITKWPQEAPAAVPGWPVYSRRARSHVRHCGKRCNSPPRDLVTKWPADRSDSGSGLASVHVRLRHCGISTGRHRFNCAVLPFSFHSELLIRGGAPNKVGGAAASTNAKFVHQGESLVLVPFKYFFFVSRSYGMSAQCER